MQYDAQFRCRCLYNSLLSGRRQQTIATIPWHIRLQLVMGRIRRYVQKRILSDRLLHTEEISTLSRKKKFSVRGTVLFGNPQFLLLVMNQQLTNKRKK